MSLIEIEIMPIIWKNSWLLLQYETTNHVKTVRFSSLEYHQYGNGNPYKPSVYFIGHGKIVQNQFRRHRTRRLIRLFAQRMDFQNMNEINKP